MRLKVYAATTPHRRKLIQVSSAFWSVKMCHVLTGIFAPTGTGPIIRNFENKKL